MLLAILILLILAGVIAVVDIAAIVIAGKITKKENNKALKRPDLIEINRKEKQK